MTELRESTSIWNVNVSDESGAHGWLLNETALASIDCSICGPHAGQRRIGRILTPDAERVLQPVLGNPVRPAIYEAVLKDCRAAHLWGYYEPLPGDTLAPTVWKDAPLPSSESLFHPMNSDLVVSSSVAEMLNEKFNTDITLTELATESETEKYFEVVPKDGPWNFNFPEVEEVPCCEECGRKLMTFKNKQSQVRSQSWKRKEISRAVLPSTAIMVSVFGSGIMVNEEVFGMLRPEIASDSDAQKLAVVG